MSDRDEIMRQWDDIRAVIAGGNKSSGPRDWFEGVLDDRDAEIDRLKAAREEVYTDASDLAMQLHAEHWPENTEWRPLDETRGVISQISNMCVLMRDQKAEIERLRAALEGKE